VQEVGNGIEDLERLTCGPVEVVRIARAFETFGSFSYT
jgi:hypothetical protein